MPTSAHVTCVHPDTQTVLSGCQRIVRHGRPQGTHRVADFKAQTWSASLLISITKRIFAAIFLRQAPIRSHIVAMR